VSSLAFAIGVYLPLATMASIYLGGCVRAFCDRGRKGGPDKASGDPGVLAASGLVAGEGLAGVLVAGLVASGMVPKSKPVLVSGVTGEIASVAMIALVCLFLYRAGRRR
jgi:uncharacterized oligopeptide transporter (OPT) family protein